MRTPSGGLLLFFSLLLSGCGFEAPSPLRTPPPAPPPAPLSSVGARLTVPVSDLAAAIDRRTVPHIVSIRDREVKCGIGRCRLTLDAVRTGPVEVTAHGNGLHVFLPFRTSAEMAMPGMLSLLRAEADAKGSLDADLSMALEPDWHMRPHTAGSVWLERSHFKLGPLKTNLADVWNANEELLSNPLFAMVDRQTQEMLPVRRQVERLWSRALQPIRIGKNPAMWLVLHPERLRADGPHVAGNDVAMDFGVDVRASVVVQDAPPVSAALPLPPPAPMADAPGRFSFAVPVLLPYRRASELALQELKKHPPKVGGGAVRIDRLDILPSGQDVVISVAFCVDQGWDFTGLFSACGSGYLRGTPRFDADTNTIRVTGVHYDLQTENLILKVARSLAGPEMGKGIEDKLKFDLSVQIDKLQALVAAALAKEQGKDIAISGQVERFGKPSLTWTAEGFLATFTAEGSAKVEAHL